jgi:hypothetical protein
MNKRDLPVYKSTDKNIVAVADCSCHREDLMASRMRPPITSNWRSGYELSNGGGGSSGGLEHDAVLSNEGESLT